MCLALFYPIKLIASRSTVLFRSSDNTGWKDAVRPSGSNEERKTRKHFVKRELYTLPSTSSSTCHVKTLCSFCLVACWVWSENARKKKEMRFMRRLNKDFRLVDMETGELGNSRWHFYTIGYLTWMI